MVIRTKIITIIALTILLTIGTTTIVLIRTQNTKMINDKFKDAEFLCDLIEQTTASAMKVGNTSEVQRILEHIGHNREIPHLRILSPDGTILKSAHKEEVGARSSEFIKSSSKESFLKPTLVNDTTINYFHNIPNQKNCYGCHDSTTPVIGIIQLNYDISRNFATFLSIKRMLIFSNIAIVVLISAILSLLFSRLITVPLKNLLAAIRDVENGNWQTTVTVSSGDELGVIGRSFNSMLQEINSLYQKNLAKERELSKIKVDLDHKNKLEDLNTQLEFKIRELETANKAVTSLSKEVKNKNIKLEKAVERLKKINEIGRILSSIIETQELMKIIIQTTADLVKAEKVIMHLKNPDRPELTIQYLRGTGIQQLTECSLDLSDDYRDLYSHGRPIFRPGSGDAASPEDGAQGSRIAVPLRMKGQIIGAMMIENDVLSGHYTEEELQLLTTLSNQAMVALENAWLYENVKSNYFSTIQSLVNALEANDRFTRGHSERVRLLSLELGRYIGLDFKELELLEHASILHDIGKIGIDNFILQKNGRLTDKEYGIIKTHPMIGDEILGPIGTLEGVRKTIIQHHERYDGKGYPFGLRGDEISLKSKILSVIDTFDAMMSERPYRKALSLYEVKTELKTNAGSQFDPYVVEAFVDLLNADEDKLLSMAGYEPCCPT
ncbi:MAG: HD domain-containing phosphohydrolase [Thermodesulfovibrionales bacterium]